MALPQRPRPRQSPGQQHERVGVEAETAIQKAVALGDVVEAQVFGMPRGTEHRSSIAKGPARLEGYAEAQRGHGGPFDVIA